MERGFAVSVAVRQRLGDLADFMETPWPAMQEQKWNGVLGGSASGVYEVHHVLPEPAVGVDRGLKLR